MYMYYGFFYRFDCILYLLTVVSCMEKTSFRCTYQRRWGEQFIGARLQYNIICYIFGAIRMSTISVPGLSLLGFKHIRGLLSILLYINLGVRRGHKYGPGVPYDQNQSDVGSPRYTYKCIKKQGKLHLTTQNNKYPNIPSIIFHKYGHFF